MASDNQLAQKNHARSMSIQNGIGNPFKDAVGWESSDYKEKEAKRIAEKRAAEDRADKMEVIYNTLFGQ